MEYCPCLCIQVPKKNRFIVQLCFSRQRYVPFSWLLLDLLPVSQTSYKQVSKRLAESMSNSKNTDNVTALYTSYLLFTFGTNLMHASPRACGILVFFPAYFYKFMLFKLWFKDCTGTIDHVRVRLRRTHAGVIRLPVALSGCVSPTLRKSI